jgi:hypothetical protein
MNLKDFNIRKFFVNIHRDLGYFISGLIIIYSLSGIALNHIDDWNPDFVIQKKEVALKPSKRENITPEVLKEIGALVQETNYKVYDFPTANQIKIYYDNASLHLNLATGKGLYESVVRRPLFYQFNVLHKNSMSGWKWFSDAFAVVLILITITGLVIARGKFGFSIRGKWLVIAGMLIPIIALIINEI